MWRAPPLMQNISPSSYTQPPPLKEINLALIHIYCIKIITIFTTRSHARTYRLICFLQLWILQPFLAKHAVELRENHCSSIFYRFADNLPFVIGKHAFHFSVEMGVIKRNWLPFASQVEEKASRPLKLTWRHHSASQSALS